MIEKRILEQFLQQEFNTNQIKIRQTKGGWTEDTYLIEISKRKPLILKIRESFNRFEAEVLRKIKGLGLSFSTSKIVKQTSVEDVYLTFYRFLDGASQETRTSEQLESTAEALAEFHKRTRGLRLKSRPKIRNYSVEEAEDILPSLPVSQKTLSKAYDAIRKASEGTLGLVHGDFCNGNVLFAEDRAAKVLGVIDFENSHIDRRIKDIANAILWDCYDKDTRRINERAASIFIRTYNRAFPLRDERGLLKSYLLMRLAIQRPYFSQTETENKLEWVLSVS